MTSQLKVDRISPANGSEIIIDGFGGVSNLHSSHRDSNFDLPIGVWTKIIHNVNDLSNPSFSPATGIFTVGSGEGGLYYINFNCTFSSADINRGLRTDISAIYVNDAVVATASSNMGQVGPPMITTPVSTIIKLNDGDQVSIYAYGEGNTTGTNDSVIGASDRKISSWSMFRIGESS